MIKKIIYCTSVFVTPCFIFAEISDSIKAREIKGGQMKIDFSNKFFEKENWEGIDFQNTDFRNSVFYDVSFTKANLTGSRFEGTTFRDVKFTRACLKNIDFRNCMFERVSFEYADLGEANLADSVFYQSDFKNANVEDTVIYCPLNNSNSSEELMIEQICKLKGTFTKQLLCEYKFLLKDYSRDLKLKACLEKNKGLLEMYQALNQQANALHTLANCLASSHQEYFLVSSVSSRCRIPSLD